MNIGILGVTGYGGAIVYQLMQQHPHVDNIYLYGNPDKPAQKLSDVVDQFYLDDTMITPFDVDLVVNEVDCLFSATSAGVAKEMLGSLIDQKFPIIDLSGDFRLSDEASYQKWYKRAHPKLNESLAITYGLTEFTKEYSAYVANPGCYATATLLGLAPLAQANVLDPNFIIVDAKSGVSGAGKSLALSSHFSFIDENLYPYKLNEHQHIPEMMNQLKQWDEKIPAIQFTTTQVPLNRGLMATIYVKLNQNMTQAQIDKLFLNTYHQTPFVHYLNERIPSLKEVVGTNHCAIGAVFNETTQVLTIVSVIDNLLKGAAGQAVQNFNQMFGFDETTALPLFAQLP